MFSSSNKKFLISLSFCLLACIAVFIYLKQDSGIGFNSTPQEQVKQFFKKNFKDDAYLDSMIKSFHLSNSKNELLKEHYKNLFDEEIINAYVDGLEAQGAFKTDKFDKNRIIAEAIQSMNALFNRGLTRVSKEDRLAYFTYSQMIHYVLTPTTCKMYTIGDPRTFSQKDFQAAMPKVLKRFQDNQVKSYLHALNNAAHAEVRNSPAKIVLSAAKSELAQQIFSNAIEQEYAKLPEAQQKRISKVVANLEQSNPMDACSYGKLIHNAVINISDDDKRDLVIIYIVSSLVG